MSNSLLPHKLQHARLSCPSLSPGVCSNPCPLSWWCHPTISFPLTPFISCPQSFPASGSFPMSWLFASGGQSNGTSASASVLPMNNWELISLRTDWFDLLVVQGTLKSLLQCHTSKASILWGVAFFIVQDSHPYMTTEKTIALTIQTLVGKVMSLFFNISIGFIILDLFIFNPTSLFCCLYLHILNHSLLGCIVVRLWQLGHDGKNTSRGVRRCEC